MLVVHDLFTRHQLEWMTRSLGGYNEVIVREFYPSYVVTLRASLDKRATPTKHTPLDHVRVRGKRVNISLPTIRRFLYFVDTDAITTPSLPSLTIGGSW